MQPFDLVIRGGTVATATDSFKADVGIRGDKVAAIADGLDNGKTEIDARGKLVLPAASMRMVTSSSCPPRAR
jgi:dihydropyrimidinase